MKHSRKLDRADRELRRRFETANDRFERGSRSTTALCILIATAIHFGLFAANPRLQVADIDIAGEEILAMPLPPDVRIPPPPQAIARPARPKVSDTAVAEEITIAPTTFEANPVETLPDLPPVAAKKQEQMPFYVPREVDPRLLNETEITVLLTRMYPQALCDAGIEGKVLLWIFVNESGGPAACRVHTSSGYPRFDKAAKEVVSHMVFAPAMHMDKPVAVWIALPVEFTTL
jgi:protein TonB